jgi:hypothetical protein
MASAFPRRHVEPRSASADAAAVRRLLIHCLAVLAACTGTPPPPPHLTQRPEVPLVQEWLKGCGEAL